MLHNETQRESRVRENFTHGLVGEVKPSFRRKRGFTLIELLVVIAIISILASMLMPALKNAMDSAKKITCVNNLKQIYLSTVQYANDFDGKLPQAGWNGLDTNPAPGGFASFFTNGKLYPETVQSRQFMGIGMLAAAGYISVGEGLLCPSSPPAAYPYVGTVTGLQAAFDSGMTNPSGTGSTSITYVNGLYFFYTVGGGRIGRPGQNIGYHDSSAPYYNSGSGIPATSYYQCRFDATGTDAGNTDNACHNAEGLNSAYYDGHVKWITIPPYIAGTWWDYRRGNSGKDGGYGGQGIWPYTAYADTQ